MTTMNATRPPGMSFVPVQEQGYCEQCTQACGRVETNIDAKSGVQTVLAYCAHCNILYRMRRILSGGAWTILAAAEAVKDRRVIVAFLLRKDAAENSQQAE